MNPFTKPPPDSELKKKTETKIIDPCISKDLYLENEGFKP